MPLARSASRQMANAETKAKNRALLELAKLMDQSQDAILAANRLDVEAAATSGISEALIDRLTMTGKRLEALSSDLRSVAELPDPVGERFDERGLPNGMKLWKQRVPLQGRSFSAAFSSSIWRCSLPAQRWFNLATSQNASAVHAMFQTLSGIACQIASEAAVKPALLKIVGA